MRKHTQTIIEVEYLGGPCVALVWCGTDARVYLRRGERLMSVTDEAGEYTTLREATEHDAKVVAINEALAQRLFAL